MNEGKINKLRCSVTPSLNNLSLIEVSSKGRTDGQVKSVIFQQKGKKLNFVNDIYY
jgi:hypothetical protein